MKHVKSASDQFYVVSNIDFFRSDFNTFYKACSKFYPSGHQVLSRKERNKAQRSVNGNITHPIMFQNIPGKCGPDRVGDIITDILDRYKPLVLFVGEVRADVVADKTPHGYVHRTGTLKFKKNPRMSMIIKDGITFKVEELKIDVPTCCVNIQGWRLIGFYREWRKDGIDNTDHVDDQMERLRTLVKALNNSKKKGKTLALGDMNIDLYNVVTDHQKKLDDMRNVIEDEIISDGWLQMIHDITRSQTGQESSCLDHIYITHPTFVENVENVNVSSTDHNIICANLQFEKPVFIPQTFSYRDVEGIEENVYEEEFLRGRIYEVYKCKEVDLCLDILENKILRALNKVAPEKTVTTRENHAPWMTPELKKAARKRDKMRLKAVREKDKEKRKQLWLEFKTFQKEVNGRKVKAKNFWISKDLQEGSCKEKWAKIQRLSKYVSRKKGGEKGGAMEIVTDEGKKVDDPAILANFMNSFFKRKVSKLQEDLEPDQEISREYTQEYLQNKVFPERCFRPVSKRKVKKIMKKLKNTGAMGRDKIPTSVIKRYRHVIGPPLTHLINLCLRKRQYPSGWKLGLVKPLPKGGDLTQPKNWRPIVLNCVLSKVLEGVINEQLMNHFETWGLYSNSQHAYRHHRSCSSALQDLNTIQADMRNRGLVTAVLTTDVSAGFNLISKDILIPKMKQLGLDDTACETLANYLTKRRTKCVIDNKVSEEIELDVGVGEGSCLGPTCFSCSMSDISVVARRTEKRMLEEHNTVVEAHTDEFADDATGALGAPGEEQLQQAVNIMLEEFLKFYSANGLCLNVDKCALVVHRVKPKTMDLFCGPPASINGPPSLDMKEKPVVRLLGLWWDSELKFETHCQKVIGGCYAKLGAMRRLVGHLPLSEILQVCESLIISSIEWCSEIYLRSKKNQVKIQRLLNSVMRTILRKSLKDRVRVSDLLKQCGWLNSSNLCRRAMLCNVKRVIEKGVAPFSFSLCHTAPESKQYSFRTHRAIRCGWYRATKFVRQSFLLESLILYNEMSLAGKHFEDDWKVSADKRFRIYVTDKLPQLFGNDNL